MGQNEDFGWSFLNDFRIWDSNGMNCIWGYSNNDYFFIICVVMCNNRFSHVTVISKNLESREEKKLFTHASKVLSSCGADFRFEIVSGHQLHSKSER